MAQGEVDLKILLEHDFKMIQSIAAASRLLVNELDANHHWITQSNALFTRLGNISANLAKLLDTCEPLWANKTTAFTKPEAAKLWKTAAGLWSALPGEQKKFDEHTSRRRRDRIMGQKVEDSPELEAGQLEADKATYDQLLMEIDKTCAEMLGRIAALPEGLYPVAQGQQKPNPAAPPLEQGNDNKSQRPGTARE